MSAFKSYLGDGVYVDFDGFDIVLTTEDGRNTTNTIVLEPAVLGAFDQYRKQLPEKLDHERKRLAQETKLATKALRDLAGQKEPDGDMGRMEHDDRGDN